MGRGHEDGLHVPTHIEFGQQPVALVQDEVLDLGQVEGLAFGREVEDTAWGADHNVGHFGLEGRDVRLDGHASEVDLGLDVGKVLGEALVLFLDLEGEFAGVAENNHVAFAGDGGQLEGWWGWDGR